MQEQHSQSGRQEQRAGCDRRNNNGRSNYNGPERRCTPDRRRTRNVETTYFEWASHFLCCHELAQLESESTGDTPQLDSV